MNNNSSNVFKAGIGYTIGNYMIKGLSFLTIPIFSRILSTDDYGLFNTYIAVESIMCSIVGLALHTSLKNAKYKFGDEYEKYISSVILLEILSMFAWCIIGLVSADFIYSIIGFTPGIIVLLVIHCTCSSILSIYNVHLSLTYSYKSYIGVAAFNAIFNVVLSIVLIYSLYENKRYVGRVVGTVFPLIFVAIYIIYKAWKRQKPIVSKRFFSFGALYSLPLIPHAISQVILNQFDRIMISRMVGNGEAGIYSFAYSIYSIVEVTKVSLDNIWAPWFYERYQKEKYDEIKKKSSQYAAGMLIFTILVMLVSPEIIKFLGTEEYYDAIYIVIPICAAGFFSFLYTLPAQVEYFMGKTIYIAIGTGTAAVLNIILNVIFIKRFGYIAAAYTTELTYILYFAFHYLISKRLEKKGLFSVKCLLCVTIICIIASIVIVHILEYVVIRWSIALSIIIITCILLRNKIIKINK